MVKLKKAWASRMCESRQVALTWLVCGLSAAILSLLGLDLVGIRPPKQSRSNLSDAYY